MKSVAPILASLILAGCGYVPLDLEENVPTIEDSFPDRELIAFGTSTITRRNAEDTPVCTLEQDIVGWVETELEPVLAGCFGCTENLSLALSATDGAECHSVGDIPTFAIGSMDLLRQVNPDLHDNFEDRELDGADGVPVAFASINWWPNVGHRDTFTPQVVLWNKEDSGLDFAREYIGYSPFAYGLSDGEDVLWSIELSLTE